MAFPEFKRLSDLSPHQPLSVEKGTPIGAVLDLLDQKHISSVIIEENKKPIGIFTERDALRLVAAGSVADDAPISEVMTPDPITCPVSCAYMEGYLQLTRHDIRHMVLVDETGCLAGVVTETDFVRALQSEDFLRPKVVKEVMTREPATLSPTESVQDALNLMVRLGISSVLMSDSGKAVGIITERDVFQLHALHRDLKEVPLAEVMKQPVASVEADTPVTEANDLMKSRGIRRLAVHDENGQLSGVLSRHDLLKDLTDHYTDFLRDLVRAQVSEISDLRTMLDAEPAFHSLFGLEHQLGVVAADLSGSIQYANRAARSLLKLGEKLDTAYLVQVIDAMGGDGDAFQLSLENGKGDAQQSFRLISGEDMARPIVVSMNGSRMTRPDGSPAGYLVLVRDITLEQEAEGRFRQLFDAMPIGAGLVDLSTESIVDINPALLKMSGYTRDEVMGRSTLDLGVWPSTDERERFYDALRTGHAIHGWTGQFRAKDGTEHTVNLSAEIVQILGGPHALLLVQDITRLAEQQALIQHQNELFTTVFEAIPDAYVITDLDRQIVLANKAMETVFGYKPAQIAGKRTDILYADKRDFERQGVERFNPSAKKQLEPYLMEYRRADGEVFTGETIGTSLIDHDGQSLGYLGGMRDVTERERNKQSLKEQNQRIEDILTSTADWFWELDDDGKYVFVSDKVSEVLGYEPQWLIGKRPFDIMPADEARKMAVTFGEIVQDRTAFRDLENICLHHDGRECVMSTTGTPVFDAAGALKGYRGIDRDITDMVAVRRVLEQNEAQLRGIFDHANVGILFLTGYRILERGNRRLAEIFGYDSPEDMVGFSMRQLHLSEERFDSFGKEHYEQLRQREELHIEYPLRHRDGRAIWCVLSGAAVDQDIPADLSKGVIWTVDDISERKQKEEELEGLNRQLSAEHALFTTGPTMLFRWLPQPSWPVDFCSENTASILGVDAHRLMSGDVSFASLVHPDDLERVAAEVAQFSAEGCQDFEQEYRLRGADGGWRNFFDVTHVERDSDGQVVGFRGYLVDITERRRTEAELRDLLDAIPDLIFMKDEKGTYLELNQAFARFVGKPANEICGRSDEELFGKETADEFREHDLRMLESGESRRNEEWVDYPDGDHRLLDTLKLPFDTGDGEHAGVLGISRDITRQRDNENALIRAEEMAGLASGHVDLRTGHVHWSGNVYALFGVDRQRTQPGMDAILEMVPEPYCQELKEAWAGLKSGDRERWEGEFPIEHPTRGERWMHAIRRLERDKDGDPRRLDGVVKDITEERRMHMELAMSENLYRTMFESTHLPILILSNAGKLERVNGAACSLLGYEGPQALLGASPAALSPPHQRDEGRSEALAQQHIARAIETGRHSFEWIHQHRDGSPVPVEVSLSRIDREDDVQIMTTWRDLRDEPRAMEMEERASVVFENTNEGIMITDADNRIISVNPAFERVTGYSEQEVRGKSPKVLQSGKQVEGFYAQMWDSVREKGSWSGEIWNRRKDGTLYAEWLSISTIQDPGGRVTRHIGVFSDLTDARESEEMIDYLSHYDVVTGLPNTSLMRSRLQQLCDAAVAGEPVVVIGLNIDGFQRVVSRYGHELSDAVLKEIGDTLVGGPANAATATRLGADTYIFAQPIADEGLDPLRVAHAMQEKLLSGVQVTGLGKLSLSSCVGIALYPVDGETPSALIRNTESALREAKQKGPGTLAFYQTEMTDRAGERLELEQMLRSALANDEFVLYYQPKVDLETAAIDSAEALIRWRKPDGELVAPGAFIPVIETSDMVDPVSEWVVREACAALARWQKAGLPGIRLSINASGSTVTSGRLRQFIQAAIDEIQIKPESLEVELLESVLLDDPNAAEKELEALHKLGVGIQLDDFGTGFSSLGYLKRYPFDGLKIDQSFIRDLVLDPDDMAIVRSTISMAHNLGLRATAEGVETDAQVNHLVEMGCDHVQGYRISRPVPESEFVKLLSGRQSGLIPRELRELMTRGILLVEDDEHARLHLKTILELNGWFVFEAADGEEAMHRLALEPVSVVLADYRLPGMTGLDLLERVKRLYPSIVRAMVTIEHDPGVMLEAINRAGVARFLTKPVGQEELVEAMKDCFLLAKQMS